MISAYSLIGQPFKTEITLKRAPAVFQENIICVFYCPQPGKTHIGLENAPNPQDIGKSPRTSRDWFFSFRILTFSSLYITGNPLLTNTSLKLTPRVEPCCSSGLLLKKYKYNITGLKTPTGKRQPVGYLQAWPRIWTWDDREQLPGSNQSGTRTRDWIANPTRWPLGHATPS